MQDEIAKQIINSTLELTQRINALPDDSPLSPQEIKAILRGILVFLRVTIRADSN